MNGPTTLQRNLIRLWIYAPVALLVGLMLAIEDIEWPGILVGMGIAVLLALFIRWFETQFSMHATVQGQRRSNVINLLMTTVVITVGNAIVDRDLLGCLVGGVFGIAIVFPFVAFFDLPTGRLFAKSKKRPN